MRTALARELVRLLPTVVRGTAPGIIAIAGADAGAQDTDDPARHHAAAEKPARTLARSISVVVALSGPAVFVTDDTNGSRITNGDGLLAQVAGGAVMSAFAAVDEDRFATSSQ
ncbi:hydroxyethylthiazole kinase [Actinacidiphila acidipaludis]|uniref:hydroxyethylthiazole kinase n=1 Tax=Actinacidiphila acidipaludis TaxID=2873382 RepID=A0ABS7QGU2_9ACTN|nr:hydroxyethylthiazole kinase [Streptomyces acidipaludis]MBY8881655.1 hydroxyethylthiazole kinase [Streptomyces acidipaludis]